MQMLFRCLESLESREEDACHRRHLRLPVQEGTAATFGVTLLNCSWRPSEQLRVARLEVASDYLCCAHALPPGATDLARLTHSSFW